jgi:phospholipase/carboxylesterase
MGTSADLAPFAASLGIDARFIFPEGIVDLAPLRLRGRAWWAVDEEKRAQAIACGPRDMSTFVPEGLDRARNELDRLLDEMVQENPQRPLVLGGFSQGAMLACDVVLRTGRAVAGLVLFSGARIGAGAWDPLYASRRDLKVFMSHGRADDDLSFTAAESFLGDLQRAQWDVTWCPFDGGHEIPIFVWRAFKRWLKSLP